MSETKIETAARLLVVHMRDDRQLMDLIERLNPEVCQEWKDLRRMFEDRFDKAMKNMAALREATDG